jgi:hypothetical protein
MTTSWSARNRDLQERQSTIGIHDDRAVDPDHVVAERDIVAPPGVLDVPLQLDPERSVIPEAVEAAVDLARREDDPSALAERNQLVHVHRSFAFPEGA